MSAERHPAALRLVHWITAALVLSALAVGLSMVDDLSLARHVALQMHKLTGLLVLVLTLLRIGVRLTTWSPPVPASLPPLQRHVASASHVALYGLLLLVPACGLAMQWAAGNPVVLPGGTVLPSLIAPDLATYGVLRQAHGMLAWSLLAVVLLHIAAALHHALVRRDGLLRRML